MLIELNELLEFQHYEPDRLWSSTPVWVNQNQIIKIYKATTAKMISGFDVDLYCVWLGKSSIYVIDPPDEIRKKGNEPNVRPIPTVHP